MAKSYDQAVSELYRAPFESFVTERKRLAVALKAEGDKLGAARLAKLARPSISAWAVNQLWWQARSAFDELFETAAELRKGKLSAAPAHRKVLAKLGTRAHGLLSEAGHSANDATLRRVTMTLSGLAAAGSFEPDTPGALTKDREPPGFEAFGIASSSDELDEAAPPESNATKHHESAAAARLREAEAAEREAEAAADRKRQAEAAAKRLARRKELDRQLADAKTALAERERERDHLEKQLATAQREVERARADVEGAQAALEAD